jgi:hypothetical protein
VTLIDLAVRFGATVRVRVLSSCPVKIAAPSTAASNASELHMRAWLVTLARPRTPSPVIPTDAHSEDSADRADREVVVDPQEVTCVGFSRI